MTEEDEHEHCVLCGFWEKHHGGKLPYVKCKNFTGRKEILTDLSEDDDAIEAGAISINQSSGERGTEDLHYCLLNKKYKNIYKRFSKKALKAAISAYMKKRGIK